MTLESRLAEALDDGNHGGLAALQSELIDTADREVILDRLSRHRSPVVRAWTSGVARDLADERYVPMLRRLARDRDIDVRNVALQDLRTRWPAELPALLPHIRRELDGANAVQAMWLIARFVTWPLGNG